MHHHIAGQQILQFAQNGFFGMLPDHGFNHQGSVDIMLERYYFGKFALIGNFWVQV